MPIYEYLCDSCGHRFEEYRRATSRTVPQCPECGGCARKVFRPVGIIFKGSGFHSTDYRKPEPKPARPEKEAEEAPKKTADKAAGKAKASD